MHNVVLDLISVWSEVTKPFTNNAMKLFLLFMLATEWKQIRAFVTLDFCLQLISSNKISLSRSLITFSFLNSLHHVKLSSSKPSRACNSSKKSIFGFSTLPSTWSFHNLKSAFKALSLQAKTKPREPWKSSEDHYCFTQPTKPSYLNHPKSLHNQELERQNLSILYQERVSRLFDHEKVPPQGGYP